MSQESAYSIQASLSQLRLDRENPRISITPRDKDRDIIKKFADESDLKELLTSMSSNGYMDIEPLVVIKGDTYFIVLEGNRRLAALMLFNDPLLALELKIDVPKVPDNYATTLKGPFSIHIVESREAARGFIGFKHINGPHKWDSYAKGKYATIWYRAGQQGGLTVQDIATKIGDSHDTVKKMIKAYMIIEQAENEGIYSVDDRMLPSFAFSHLYTALTRVQYRTFLGLDADWHKNDPQENSIPQNKLDSLGKVLEWLYGSKSKNTTPVIRSQNPDLRNLGAVINYKPALMALETNRDLNSAFALLTPTEEQFAMDLTNSMRHLESAMKNIAGYTGGLIDVGKKLQDTSQILYRIMLQKETLDDEGGN